LNKANLYAIAAPSGGGKSSLINALLQSDQSVELSISHTTRAPRPGEENGVHYHFVDDAEFQRLTAGNLFLEHARVFGHCYGTSREFVEQKLSAGKNVILDIDWQGARQVRENFPACRSIFILPPSLESLRHRLIKREQDSQEVIDRRMQAAPGEISHWDEFDFLIINDDFDLALGDLRSIVRHNRLLRKIKKQRYEHLLAELLKNR
jgi:guanylate kinase